jgi:hypothetical protein
MAGDRVRCAVCKNQTNGFCVVKKVKIALNKRRKCDKFKIDPTRVRLKETPKAIRGIPKELYKDLKSEYRKSLKEEAVRKELEKKQQANKYADAIRTGNEKFPLTGDLSRFTSSAGKGE